MSGNVIFALPGIFFNEIDKSAFLSIISTTILAIVTTASAGLVDTPVLVGSYTEMVAAFGYPSAAYPGLLVARDYFKAGGGQCWIVRVAVSPTAATTSLTLNSGGPVSIPAYSPGTFFDQMTMKTQY